MLKETDRSCTFEKVISEQVVGKLPSTTMMVIRFANWAIKSDRVRVCTQTLATRGEMEHVKALRPGVLCI